MSRPDPHPPESPDATQPGEQAHDTSLPPIEADRSQADVKQAAEQINPAAGAPIPLPTPRTMSVAEWIGVSGNPHQRDTVRHLERALHLRHLSAAHLQVSAAQLPDGSLIKIDGHTRALKWEIEPETAPEFVLVAIYPVATPEAAEALYHHFDNKVAVDTASDDLSGAFKAAGFVPNSAFFQGYRGTAAIKAATMCMLGLEGGTGGGTALDIYELVPRWLDELRSLDAINPTPQRFPHPILTAALLTIRRRGYPDAVDVWDRYQRDAGFKNGNEMDGVEALTRLSMNSAGLTIKTITSRAIGCVETQLRGRLVTKAVHTSTARYCGGMKREMETFADLLPAFRKEIASRERLRRAAKKAVADWHARCH